MPFDRLLKPFRTKSKAATTLSTQATPSRTVDETLLYGLITLAEGIDPVVDIVAVHGLDGHREESWMANRVNWLRDFLPTEIPNARILSWGYDARTHSISHIGGKYIYDHGITLVSDLRLKRALTKTETRPIIFIAHSLGGIVLKSALIHSEAARQGALEEHRSIKLSTYGIIFMGTPHLGAAGVELGQLVLRIASLFIKTDNRAVRHIERDSEWLQQQLRQYAPISQDFVTKFAYELFPTMSIALEKIMVVPQASAVVPGATDGEPIAIPADHVSMVKFATRQDVGYQKVAGQLKIMAEKASDIIRARWDEQDKIQEVLAKREDEFSIPFSLYGVPEIEEFVGRKDELTKVNEAFQGDGSERTIVVLQGLGGIGKTQLAVKYLKDHRDRYSAVLWLNGSSEDTLKQSFAVAAKRLYKVHKSSALLRVAAEAHGIDEVVASLRQWLSIKENYRWMLAFDNYDNPKTPGNKDPQAYDIKPYLPEAHHGSIIITTRSSGLKIGKVFPIRKLLDTGECISILSSTSGRPNLDQDKYAYDVVKKLDGLPLALATAGAYIGQVSISLKDYLRFYTASWLKLQQTSPELLPYEDRTLYTTWNLSFEHIQNQNGLAARLLRLWAYFDNQDVWYELLAGGKGRCPEWFSSIVDDELSFNEIIRILCDHALIEPLEVSEKYSGGYSMHSCVHAWTKHVLNREQEMDMGRIALSCVASSVPTAPDAIYWDIERRLLPHAYQCLEVMLKNVDSSTADSPEHLSDIGNIGLLFEDYGKLKEAEAIYERVLDSQEKSLGPEHLSTLDTVNKLGYVSRNQGKLKEAEALCRRALDGREKALGLEHDSTLGTMYNLGILSRVQGKLKEAEAMLLRVLDVRENALGSDHPVTLGIVESLGLLYSEQFKMKEAEAMLQRAVTGKKKRMGPDHISTLGTFNNLGIIYREQNRLKEAEAIFQRVLESMEKAVGPDHIRALETMNNLGIIYGRQGQFDKAESIYRRGLDGSERALGLDHPLTLDMVNSLGFVFRIRGKLEEAETMHQQALDGREKVFGTEHPATLSSVNNLGLLYSDQGKLIEAAAMYHRALHGREKTLGPEHPSTIATLNNLGFLYSNQGKLADSATLLRRALECKTKTLGSEHPSTLCTINHLGRLYSIQGKLEEAEANYQLALDGNEKALGLEHPSTLDTVNNLGVLYSSQGKLKEAEAMCQRALHGREKILGPEHPETLDTLNNLGSLYIDQGKSTEADAILQRALDGKKKALGPEHPSTLCTVNNLGRLYSIQGKLKEAEAAHQLALDGSEKALGPENPITLQTIHSLGFLYSGQGKLKAAESMYRRVLDGREKVLGPEHPVTLETVTNLGILLRDQGLLGEAEAMFQRVLGCKEKALGPDHPSTLGTLSHLARLSEKQNKLKEAEDLFQRILSGMEKVLGPEHKATLDAAYDLGHLYKLRAKYDEAEHMLGRALEGYEKTLGPEHPYTIETINVLATLYDDRADYGSP